LSWKYLDELKDVPDAELTQEGIELRDLAIKLANNPGYVLTEDDKNIYDQRWRKIYK
jgi:hypothetical protein